MDTQVIQSNTPLHIPSFAEFSPDVMLILRKTYMQYVSHINKLETGKEVSDGAKGPLNTVIHSSGLPWLPMFEPEKHKENMKIMQSLLRKYFAQHYGRPPPHIGKLMIIKQKL